jgi:hypothetical protein
MARLPAREDDLQKWSDFSGGFRRKVIRTS